MKTTLTLLVTVAACYSSLAQTAPPVKPGQTIPAPVAIPPLSHEDSLVMTDAGLPVDPPKRAGLEGRSFMVTPADSLSGLASLLAADSLLRLRIRVRPFPVVIEEVLRDFPNKLGHITGPLVLAQGEIENYASLVAFDEGGQCIITRYHSTEDTTASWQAKMYTSDDFGKASHEYHELYKQLEHCYVRLVDGSVIYLKGVWEPAREEAAFTTSTLRLSTGDFRYREVKVELELVYLLADWAVNINIVSKKRDDEIGGSGGTGGEEL